MTANEETLGDALAVAEQPEKHRRLARLFGLAVTSNSPWEKAGIMARIGELLEHDGDHVQGDDGR